MANYTNLKAAIDNVIKTNGNKEITGSVLNQTLNAMVNSLGAGYQFAGIATPSTNPGTPDQNVFYFATQAGTYSNFNNIVLPDGISILSWNGSWSSNTLSYSEGVFDISAYHATGGTLAKYADLTAALGTSGANIPEPIRKCGRSVKYVQSSDNKYVQYLYHGTSTAVANFTNTDNWEKTNLETEFEAIDKHVINEFVQGVNYPTSAGHGNSAVYCRTEYFVCKKGDVIITTDDSLNFFAQYSSDATAPSAVENYLMIYVAKADGYVRLNVNKAAGGNITPVECNGKLRFFHASSSVSLFKKLQEYVNENSKLNVPVIDFVNGSINAGTETSSTLSCRSYFLYLKNGCIIDCDDSQLTIMVHKYSAPDNASWVSNTYSLNITENAYYRIVATSTSNITPLDILGKVSYRQPGSALTLLSGLEEQVKDIKEIINIAKTPITVEQGVVYPNSGGTAPSTTRCRTGYLNLKANDKIVLDDSSLFNIGVIYFGDGQGTTPTWNDVSYNEYLVPVNGVYRFNIYKQDVSADIVPAEVNGKLFILDCTKDISEVQDIMFADFYDRQSANALDEFAAKVTSLDKDGARFLFFTDIHHINLAGYANVYKNYYKVITAKKFISKGMVDCSLIGGDLTTENVPKSLNLKRITQVMEQLNKGYVGKPILVTKGNHDTALPGNSSSWTEDMVISDKEWHDIVLRNIEGVAQFPSTEATYYYYDDTFRKVRYICIDSFSYPIKADGTLNNPRDIEFINQTQYNWLVGTALNFSGIEDKENWSVIVFSHSSAARNKNNNQQALYDIFNAFISGGSVSKDYSNGDSRFNISISADFTSQGAMTIQAFIHGHLHWDEVYIDPTSPILQIAVIGTATNYPAHPSYGVAPERVEGELSDQGFDVFTCDNENKTIYTSRFGAGNDRIIHGDVHIVNVGGTITLNSVLDGTLTWTSQDTGIATISDGVVTGVTSYYVAVFAEDAAGKREYFIVYVE